MTFTILKVFLASVVVAFASWLSGTKPALAGFVTALPLVSILAIAFSYMQFHDPELTAKYARSIIFAVPVSWFFFVPFFFVGKSDVNFWVMYVLGIVLLGLGYFLHQAIMNWIG